MCEHDLRFSAQVRLINHQQLRAEISRECGTVTSLHLGATSDWLYLDIYLAFSPIARIFVRIRDRYMHHIG